MGCNTEPRQKEERAGDFRALRAKFQNDSNFSSALLQPVKSLPAETPPRQNTDGSPASHPKPKPLCRRQIPDPEQKTAPFSYLSQKSEIVQIKPVVLPRARLHELPEVRKNEDRKSKDITETVCARVVLVEDSPKQRPASYHCLQDTALASNSFRNTLNIWESALLQSDKKGSETPPQRSNRTTSLPQPKTVNIAVTPEVPAKAAENEQAVVLSAPSTPSHLQVEPVPFPTVSPPVPPRNHASSETLAHGAIRVADSPQDAHDLDRPSKTSQCSNERWHEVEKIPKPKPLPSIISLGPPPKKPPRPPNVDLGPFQKNIPDAVDDAYMTPETPETEELGTYEETMSYLKLPESSTNDAQGITHSSKAGKSENIEKQSFLLATPSSKTEDTEERGPPWNHETTKRQQAKESGKICAPGAMLAKPKITGEYRGEKGILQEETTPSFPRVQLAKDGNVSDDYVCLEALKTDEENSGLAPRTPKVVQVHEEVYDDVEGIQREFQTSDAHSSLTSETFSEYACEETYEDVRSEGYSSTKSDDVKEKLKGLGKFFKKGKFKMKNSHLKENSRILSSSAPNLDVMAPESMVYDNIDAEQNDTKPSSRNFFKVKKHALEKNSKMTKEEKQFREKFMYDKEIGVINTAVAHCSNTLTKGKLDLRITAGEQLEVIDITEGNQLICRNSEGKYGFVLLEHLNFSRH
ncbi:FYN-binding protein 2 isoform X1 [Podarcis raffonei]|uniref:FYN-binding protein 2 isoform X1 n=1 Tax=Podarcis raffonei TaxID=65483 RepID=UPI00232971A6|nr:FYN-binding protein 2 isoform X1 [Podarcis raffonei]